MSAPLDSKAALAERIRKGWHEAGLYGRRDVDPDWLDGIASIAADALLGWPAINEPELSKAIGYRNEPTDEEVQAMLTLVRGGWLKLELTLDA